jgi:hypothetical protein
MRISINALSARHSVTSENSLPRIILTAMELPTRNSKTGALQPRQSPAIVRLSGVFLPRRLFAGAAVRDPSRRISERLRFSAANAFNQNKRPGRWNSYTRPSVRSLARADVVVELSRIHSHGIQLQQSRDAPVQTHGNDARGNDDQNPKIQPAWTHRRR